MVSIEVVLGAVCLLGFIAILMTLPLAKGRSDEDYARDAAITSGLTGPLALDVDHTRLDAPNPIEEKGNEAA